jgi:glycosyltransferase involved in cell wall biosynthesis
VFAQAEHLVQLICAERHSIVCFWNVDAKVKLLSVKTLSFTHVHFVEVSPSDSCFKAINNLQKFCHLIAFTDKEYFQRLNSLVVKFEGPVPGFVQIRPTVIRNGVYKPDQVKTDYSIGVLPKIVLSSRIAPGKFVLQVVSAMTVVWKSIPNAELHIFGDHSVSHKSYFDRVLKLIKDCARDKIFYHGMDAEVRQRLHEFDLAVVLGRNQGCPNALLEALASGVPSIANDDGGTASKLFINELAYC